MSGRRMPLTIPTTGTPAVSKKRYLTAARAYRICASAYGNGATHCRSIAPLSITTKPPLHFVAAAGSAYFAFCQKKRLWQSDDIIIDM